MPDIYLQDYVLCTAWRKPSTPSRWCAMLHILARGLRAGNGLWQSTWKGRVDILEVGYKTNMEAFNLQSHFLRTHTIMESRTLLDIFESKLEETARLFFSNNMITVDLVTTIYNVLFWGLAIPAVAYLLKILGGLKIGEKNMSDFPFMQKLQTFFLVVENIDWVKDII